MRLRASIGVALADRHDPAGRCEPDELLHRADQAMYAAKRGTNSWALYSPDTVGAGPGRPATRASA